MAKQIDWPADMNLAFVEGLYADFERDPASVPEEWREYFVQVTPKTSVKGNGQLPSTYRPPASSEMAIQPVPRPTSTGLVSSAVGLQDRVDKVVRAYRVRGHMIARMDPLGLPRSSPPELDASYYGIWDPDLDQTISADTLSGCDADTPRKVIERLRETYCRSIGVQFMHIDDLTEREWLQKRMEGSGNRLQLSRGRQLRILTRLTDAVIFEEFIQKKFVGAKSFSIEGCETLIPLLDLTIERAGDSGINDIIIGMAHRGRLNVLSNIMGKNAQQIFREFADMDSHLYAGRGDVKYHLGFSSTWKTSKGNGIHLSLCFNPSHLEFVNPVAVGRLRARQDRAHDTQRRRGLAILIHGDAAFAGEGVVQETLNMSELPGYTVGGTLHVIVNNQIGFTTPPEQGRSSIYASGLGKMLQIPIFHVNGEDPEAVSQVIRLAMDFRNTFKRDIVIDMYGYRRRGHNEGDEPSFTQPLLYKAIAKRKPVREAYLEHLLAQGGVKAGEAEAIAEQRKEHLEAELSAARSEAFIHTVDGMRGVWAAIKGGPEDQMEPADTTVERERLTAILEKLSKTPQEFHPDSRIARMLEQRHAMALGERPLDWSAGEALAFGSLLIEGYRVRLSGQDSERGTFSHRHAVLRDVEFGHSYVPLRHLSPRQGVLDIHNSPLSEAGVLGFDYGYSLEWPDGLICWEAQFGDFVNTAQVIIDQFISSAEDKWQRLSGLVMLLPHGFEGQGPEHSSARLERFLQLCAEDNMQVVYPTTPAQFFHVLRRQVVRPWRKPLVVMTPKSLLRHAEVVSPLEDLTDRSFQKILADDLPDASKVKRVLCCSGKVYYDLKKGRQEAGRTDVAILRFEQLYPLLESEIEAALAPYKAELPVVWVQEEPENMGAWGYLRLRFGSEMAGRDLKVVARVASASPATGSAGAHRLEQQQVIDQALGANE
ncbi:MAG: 2-oxoglutarate dehydrogenase E1 component [Acidobacteria bacterium]|nr:2-oxoglutarate dehydrogenase E1 component [Acidobacteriota bacterium]MDA1234167.1 2-oxoglutarate dehydrogenase E1 component [Acidobacteriota bacterium]